MMRETAKAARRLPSLEGLRAFEVAARHLNFTKAGAELCVTQGAISQRIKALEAELGVLLFDRHTGGLALTPRGRSLADGVRAGLDQIGLVVASLGAGIAGPLVISVLPSFASRWLVPRLHRFTALHPETLVQVVAENRAIDFKDRGTHAALRFGPGRYPGLSVTELAHDSLMAVCSPALLERAGPVACVSDLAGLPIVHDASTERDGSGTDWESWLDQVGGGGAVRLAPGLRFSQADLVLDAAVNGLGVALARASLALDDLASRRLVPLPLPAVQTMYAYYFVCRPDMSDDPSIAQFRAWLLSELSPIAGGLPSPGTGWPGAARPA